MENPGKVFLRLMKYILRNCLIHYIFVAVLIFISVLANVQGTLFMRNLIDEYITPMLLAQSPDFTPLSGAVARVAGLYGVGVVSTFAYNRILINVTQGTQIGRAHV